MNWTAVAKEMLLTERSMQPMHRPPSTGCLVRWRSVVRVGMTQWPIDSAHPAITFVSMTSDYTDPEFVRAVRALDVGRVELEADPSLALEGHFHVLHRQGAKLTALTDEEQRVIEMLNVNVLSVTPTRHGVMLEALIRKRRA